MPWPVRGPGPTQETAEALLFHDPLLIRTGLATKSKAHSHKNMDFCKEENLAGLEGVCGGRSELLWLFLSHPFNHSSFLFCCMYFCCCCCFYDSGFFVFYKTLALKDSTQHKQWPPAQPLGPSQPGGPLGFLGLLPLIPSLASDTGVQEQVELEQQSHGGDGHRTANSYI